MEIFKYLCRIFAFTFKLSFNLADTVAGFIPTIVYIISKLFKVEALVDIDWVWLPSGKAARKVYWRG